MVFHRRFFFILTVAALIAASCTKPTLIGSDFLDEEKADLKFEDNFDLSFYTEKTDSVIVHSDNVSRQLTTYLCGNVVDPIFGRYTAEIFAQPLISTLASELIGATLDSVVLQLRYDTLGNYGTLSDLVTLEVYRMTENPDFGTDYYSNRQFDFDPNPLGSKTFVPQPFDSVTVFDPSDTFKIPASIRIPLSIDKFNDLLLQDSTVFTDQDSFLNYFNGLHIKMTGANNTMLGFNLLNSTSVLSLYYDKGGTTNKKFSFIFTVGSIKTAYFEHDYSGSFVEPSLGPGPESDYWFVQGLSGLTTKMEIGNLNILGDAIINQAELEVYCTFPDGDVPPLYPPIRFLITQELTDTSLINSTDVNIALSESDGNFGSATYKNYYGGVLEKVTDGPPAVYKYSMKVTAQVKDIFQEKKENIIYFNPIQKANVPNRSVMFGPGHPEFAPRLRIYYTSL
ncbi:MAG TPA: DUF4270 family protein [Saprospiraceae bacterium]|nr:DUF4270 family protein [Saprospiraceae bacterium]